MYIEIESILTSNNHGARHTGKIPAPPPPNQAKENRL